jgi:hypothetical protein
MSKTSKRMLSLLLGAGLVLSSPAALAWSWNHRPDRRTVIRPTVGSGSWEGMGEDLGVTG